MSVTLSHRPISGGFGEFDAADTPMEQEADRMHSGAQFAVVLHVTPNAMPHPTLAGRHEMKVVSMREAIRDNLVNVGVITVARSPITFVAAHFEENGRTVAGIEESITALNASSITLEGPRRGLWDVPRIWLRGQELSQW